VDQGFPGDRWELVCVDDQSTDDLRAVLRKWSSKVRIQHIVMDRARSAIPVAANCPALGLNIAFRQARGEVVYKTDPETMPITETLARADAGYRPDRILFGMVCWVAELTQHALERGAMTPWEALEVSQQLVGPRLRIPYYFLAVFSQSLVCEIGGVDERYLSGMAGEDDDFSLRIQRAGAIWSWDFGMQALHQYHGRMWSEVPGKGHGSPLHIRNLTLLRDLGGRLGERVYPLDPAPKPQLAPREERIEQARVNVGHDWGSNSAVVSTEILE
jgi:glycosyltransferase involved in cell wall biosynthesis